ncbi:hypothetical protein G9A89_015841 [Geosiphon pyriformis]|nr:hypothetical protein G9A89_015841 [Geosiphon pyriformis]
MASAVTSRQLIQDNLCEPVTNKANYHNLLSEILQIYQTGCEHWESDRTILDAIEVHLTVIPYFQSSDMEEVFSLLSSFKSDTNYLCLQAFLTRYGFGTRPDLVHSFLLFKKAAELGSAVAQSELGYFYNHDLGVLKNRSEAFRWYSKSAQQGYALGQSNLAYWYFSGKRGKDKDDRKAFYWYNRAIDAGFFSAQYRKGLLLESGAGCVRDLHEALRCFRRACSKGSITNSCLLFVSAAKFDAFISDLNSFYTLRM